MCADVRKLTRRLEVSREHLATWPGEKLVVSAEHSSIFYDIFSDNLLEQVPANPILLTSLEPRIKPLWIMQGLRCQHLPARLEQNRTLLLTCCMHTDSRHILIAAIYAA